MNKVINSVLIVGSLVLLGGACYKTIDTNVNVVGNTNVVESNTNTSVNVNVANSNTQINNNSDITSGWNTFSLPELGMSIDFPFLSEQVAFDVQTCGSEEACDYEGYAFFGIYTPAGERGVGILGSVSEQWSPSRSGFAYEVYDLQGTPSSFEVIYGLGKKISFDEIANFEVDGHQIAVFDLTNSIYETEAYLGVIKLSVEGKYKAVGIELKKQDISQEDFLKILNSAKFE